MDSSLFVTKKVQRRRQWNAYVERDHARARPIWEPILREGSTLVLIRETEGQKHEHERPKTLRTTCTKVLCSVTLPLLGSFASVIGEH